MDTFTIDHQELLGDAPFRERHQRTIDAPAAEVWHACLAVTPGELRTLAPLMALRALPRVLRDRRRPDPMPESTLLEMFEEEGFVVLRRDPAPADGRAAVVFAAAGQFWSPSNNHPVPFDDPSDFVAFDEPDQAKTVATLEVEAIDDRRTRVITETRVAGTDDAATRKFRPYWMLIRPFSGLIRRSWLAAIARRVEQPE